MPTPLEQFEAQLDVALGAMQDAAEAIDAVSLRLIPEATITSATTQLVDATARLNAAVANIPPVPHEGELTMQTGIGYAVLGDLRNFVTDDRPKNELRFEVGQAINGVVTLEGDGRTVKFTPNAGFSGIAMFSYWVTDLSGARVGPTMVRVIVG